MRELICIFDHLNVKDDDYDEEQSNDDGEDEDDDNDDDDENTDCDGNDDDDNFCRYQVININIDKYSVDSCLLPRPVPSLPCPLDLGKV